MVILIIIYTLQAEHLPAMIECNSTTYYLAAPATSENKVYAAGTSLDIYFSDLEESILKQKKVEDLDLVKYIQHQGSKYKVEGLLKHLEGERLGAVWMYVTPCEK
jgi:hypothetical protein